MATQTQMEVDLNSITTDLSITRYQTLFSPHSVVVIGASRNEKSVGYGVLQNLIFGGFKGEIYAVNPNAKSILDIKVHPSVYTIPHDIDLAIIAVPPNHVVNTLRACGEKGIKNIIVITAGFKEIGATGEAAQNEMASIAREFDMALVGPNCLGILNTAPEVLLNATFSKRVPKPGNVSFISQSGAMGILALEFAASNDIGFSKFVSIGNKAVLNENDLLLALGEDPASKVILIYLESLKDPKEFIRIASDITSGEDGTPILVIKTGRGKTGQRAASSHTGALAEKDDVLDFLFDQCGVIRVDSMEDLFNFGLCLANQPVPKGDRLAIVTNAGGAGIIAADEADKLQIKVPELSGKLKTTITERLSANVSVNNPIDLVGDADESRYEAVLQPLVHSDEIDAILVICTPQIMTDMEQTARVVSKYSEEARKQGKTLVTSFVGFDESMKTALSLFDKYDIPNYTFTENAVRALAASMKYSKYKSLPATEIKQYDVNKETVAQVLKAATQERRHFFTEPESYTILEAYGFSIANARFCVGLDEVMKTAAHLQFPLVAKIVSPDIVHKFDVGGVVTQIKNPKELNKAYHKIMDKAMSIRPQPEIKGILIQEMVKDGVEIIIGANYDEHYGHLLMFGLGGTFVEVFKDVTFRMAPVSTHDASAMVQEIKAFSMLKGFRGMPPRDLVALEECITRLSQLLTEFPEIKEIDLNPVFALQKGVTVADARILL